jgi:drug/metabolite transporter (DMT)-like permease
MLSRNRVIVYAEALGAVVIWGGTFIATKVALRDVSPATIVWMRFGLGVIVLGAAVLLRKQFVLPAKSELGYFAMLGFLGVTFHQWLQANGLVTAQASTTAWIVATTPVFMALLGWSILKEYLGWLRSGGILLAALGVLLIVSGGNILALFAGKEGTLGDVLVMISAPNWAVFSVLSRRGLQSHPAARMMFFVMTLGWLFTSAWIFGLGPGLREIPKLTPPGWISILLLGVFGSGLAYIAWYDALQALPASQLGAFLYIEPLVTVVIAAIILGESFTFISLLGGGIILFGVYLVNQK